MAADGSGKLKGLREQMVAAAQALADERRSQSGTSPIPANSTVNVKTTKPVLDGSALRTDERQRLARERREEREKQNAAKELQLIEREKKSKLQYEKQMEEKQRKLEEQKQKDEQKRTAVEEKRKQKGLEEKERREANVRRTLERSSQLDQRQKRWSWGGGSFGIDPEKHGSPGSSSPNPVDIVDLIPCTTEPQTEDESGSGANKRSTSTINLKQTDIVIHKRLSSSTTLLNSPDKGSKKRSSSLSRLNNKVPSQQSSPRVSNLEKKGGAVQKRSSSLSRLSSKPSSSPHLEGVKKEEKTAHRSQINLLESSVINRLLAPTQASLARSKSSAALSADGKDSPASAMTISTPKAIRKGPMRSRSIDRFKSPPSLSSDAGSPESTQKSELEKQSPPLVGKRSSSPNMNARRRSPSPALIAKRPPSPTLENKKNQKNRPPSPSMLKQRPPSPTVVHKPLPIQRPSLTSTVLSATKPTTESESIPKEKSEEGSVSEPKSLQTSVKETAAASAKTKAEPSSKTVSGSATAEEAAKILAEKRRLAREQRELDEQERIQRQEEERIKQEEMARIAEEEKVRAQEEAQILEAKRKVEEEEQQRKAQEEKVRKELEDQELLAELQLQKEEAEVRALEEAEKQRQERDKIMQQNMQERLERKKRIEEIMKRTRKADQMDMKNEDKSDQGTEDEDEDEDEEEEMSNLETNEYDVCLSGDVNGVDFCQEVEDPRDEYSEVASVLTRPDPLSPAASLLERAELFMNGDRPNIDQKHNGQFSETAAPVLSSYCLVANETVIQNQDLQFNEDETRELVQNLNGKSSTWTFEEFIDLGIHSKSSSLSCDSITSDNRNQNLIGATTIPATPKMAFEEGRVNSLPTPIETAAEI
ncbi:MAP7 domain-containing protein 3 isoform X2 [Ascaphus truei]|uniref:MAP7 domain-containing protein 3 isoform X2 n=1 Tax=Ascaphus truei TaxID=8439 RepID=UPI003F59088B